MRDLCGSFVLEVRERVRRHDLLLLAVAPVVMVLVFLLPRETRVALAFHPNDPTLVAAFASHYVHLGFGHLFSNLVGYLLLAPLAALLCLLSGDRASLYAAVPTFLLAFPLVLSGLEFALGIPGAAVGFSGINTAFFGLFVYALARYSDARVTGRDVAGPLDSAPLLFFVGLAIIAILAVPLSVVSVGIAIAAVLSALLYAEVGEPADPVLHDTIAEGGHLDLAGGGVGLFVAYPFLAFPVGAAATGTGTVNLFTHLLGFCLAFIVVYVTALVRE